jgi:hypothetical protein
LPVTPLTLQPGQIFTRPVNRHEDGVVDVFLPSRPEEKYLIQATTNFVVWDNIATNFAIANFMQLVDLDGPYYPHRFYRSAVFDSVVGGLVEAVQRDSDGSVTFQITGLQGRSYTVQASLDLVNWTALGTPIVGGTRVSFKDPNISTNSHRFYRLRSD